MTRTTGRFAPTDSYLKLIREFPLRPLRSDAEYQAATAIMERLAVRGEKKLGAGERDYLDGLDEFIRSYDERALADRPRRGTPRQRLRSLMHDTAISQQDLAAILGCGHSLVSLLLAGKRELSKDNIRALANHFRLSADYFL